MSSKKVFKIFLTTRISNGCFEGNISSKGSNLVRVWVGREEGGRWREGGRRERKRKEEGGRVGRERERV